MSLVSLLTAIAIVSAPPYSQDQSQVARALASRLLDDSTPAAEREAIVRDRADLSVALLKAMTRDLKPGTPEEYRRIPWIWRVAIAAGKRNESKELIGVLDASLPDMNAPLDDWRAVVIGGGVINGVSLSGAWPKARIDSLLDGEPRIKERWRRALDLAAETADDPKVKTGTRYDALRMLGVEPWDKRGGRLFRYLIKNVDAELQQGAISGLNDVESPAVGQALLSGIEHYSPHNLGLALDALFRDETRVSALLDALEGGRLTASKLGPARVERLKGLDDPALRERARRVLSK